MRALAENRQWRQFRGLCQKSELLRIPARIDSYRVQRTGMANRHRRMRFRSDAGPVCLPGARYTLASLFSSLDVRRYHCAPQMLKVYRQSFWRP